MGQEFQAVEQMIKTNSGISYREKKEIRLARAEGSPKKKVGVRLAKLGQDRVEEHFEGKAQEV